MGETSVFILIAMYCMSGLVMFARSYLEIRRNPQNRYYNIAQGMYLIIYILIPILVHSYVYTNGTVGHAYEVLEYDSIGVRRFYYSWIMSIVGYIGLNFGYRAVIRSELSNQCQQEYTEYYDEFTSHKYSAWMFSAIVCLIIGLIAELLWTRAYGGMIGILQYASALRSGWDTGISNNYTIFKRFVPLVQFANIVFLALAVKYKRVLPFILSIPAMVLSILYLLANDGRAPLIMHIVSLVWILFSCGEIRLNKLKRSSIILLIIGGAVALFLMHNEEILMDYFVYKTRNNLELAIDILSSLRDEFSFTVRNGQSIFYYWNEHPLTFRLPTEILSGLLGVLPSGFRPDSIEKLEKINTSYWMIGASSNYGGCPPDIIVTGIYTMNLFGIFLLPAFFGKILNYLDKKCGRRLTFENEIFFALVMYPVVRTIAYTNFDGLTLNVFYIFIGYIILWISDKIFGVEVQAVEQND